MPKRAYHCYDMSGTYLEELKYSKTMEEIMFLREIDARRKVEEWRQRCKLMLVKQEFIGKPTQV